MTCTLLSHLEQKRRLAEIRQEKSEVNRLNGLIRFHREKCLTCAGMELTTLADKFFGRKVVVIGESQP